MPDRSTYTFRVGCRSKFRRLVQYGHLITPDITIESATMEVRTGPDGDYPLVLMISSDDDEGITLHPERVLELNFSSDQTDIPAETYWYALTVNGDVPVAQGKLVIEARARAVGHDNG